MWQKKIIVVPLVQKPEHLDQVAEWLYQEWGIKKEGSSILTLREKLETFKNIDTIPINFIALKQERLVGTFNLMQFDPPARKDLSPWFASLYVAQTYRKQGIGSFLASEAVAIAKRMHIKKLYLCTPAQQKMYARLGWKPIDEVKFRNETVTIMEISI